MGPLVPCRGSPVAVGATCYFLHQAVPVDGAAATLPIPGSSMTEKDDFVSVIMDDLAQDGPPTKNEVSGPRLVAPGLGDGAMLAQTSALQAPQGLLAPPAPPSGCRSRQTELQPRANAAP